MITIKINITNPYSNKWYILYNKGGIITNNKAWELELYKTNTLLLLAFEWTKCRDHAGIRLSAGFLGIEGSAVIYDSRHWNYEKKTFKENILK